MEGIAVILRLPRSIVHFWWRWQLREHVSMSENEEPDVMRNSCRIQFVSDCALRNYYLVKYWVKRSYRPFSYWMVSVHDLLHAWCIPRIFNQLHLLPRRDIQFAVCTLTIFCKNSLHRRCRHHVYIAANQYASRSRIPKSWISRFVVPQQFLQRTFTNTCPLYDTISLLERTPVSNDRTFVIARQIAFRSSWGLDQQNTLVS